MQQRTLTELGHGVGDDAVVSGLAGWDSSNFDVVVSTDWDARGRG